MREDLDLNAFKQKLQALLDSLAEGREARAQEAAPVELDQAKMGRLSRMDALQQQAMAQASSRQNQAQERRLLAALKRIETGEYGHCLECDEAIQAKRLEFDPTALFCIACAQKAETPS